MFFICGYNWGFEAGGGWGHLPLHLVHSSHLHVASKETEVRRAQMTLSVSLG